MIFSAISAYFHWLKVACGAFSGRYFDCRRQTLGLAEIAQAISRLGFCRLRQKARSLNEARPGVQPPAYGPFRKGGMLAFSPEQLLKLWGIHDNGSGNPT
jgi:hypothetical protein